MEPRDAANRDPLIGLLALRNGLVEQGVLAVAFRSWARDKTRPMVENLAARGAIGLDDRALLEGLARKHLRRPGDDVERSLAALDGSVSTHENEQALTVQERVARDHPDVAAFQNTI